MLEYSDNILITLNSDYGRKGNGSMNSKISFDFNSILQECVIWQILSPQKFIILLVF